MAKFQDDIQLLDKQVNLKDPAKNIIDTEPEEPAPTTHQRPQREYKSKRFQMLIKPSLYYRLQELADKTEGASMNGVAHRILEDYFKTVKA